MFRERWISTFWTDFSTKCQRSFLSLVKQNIGNCVIGEHFVDPRWGYKANVAILGWPGWLGRPGGVGRARMPHVQNSFQNLANINFLWFLLVSIVFGERCMLMVLRFWRHSKYQQWEHVFDVFRGSKAVSFWFSLGFQRQSRQSWFEVSEAWFWRVDKGQNYEISWLQKVLQFLAKINMLCFGRVILEVLGLKTIVFTVDVCKTMHFRVFSWFS